MTFRSAKYVSLFLLASFYGWGLSRMWGERQRVIYIHIYTCVSFSKHIWLLLQSRWLPKTFTCLKMFNTRDSTGLCAFDICYIKLAKRIEPLCSCMFWSNSYGVHAYIYMSWNITPKYISEQMAFDPHFGQNIWIQMCDTIWFLTICNLCLTVFPWLRNGKPIRRTQEKYVRIENVV